MHGRHGLRQPGRVSGLSTVTAGIWGSFLGFRQVVDYGPTTWLRIQLFRRTDPYDPT